LKAVDADELDNRCEAVLAQLATMIDRPEDWTLQKADTVRPRRGNGTRKN
jgi:hypothetical protein